MLNFDLSLASTSLLTTLLYCCCCYLCFFQFACVGAQSNAVNCRNPNRKLGRCISIYNCDSLLSVLNRIQQIGRSLSEEEEEELRFVKESQCQNGVGRQPYVCCTEDTGFAGLNVITTTSTTPTTPTTLPPRREVVVTPGNGLGNILPQPPDCGHQSFDDKIYGGNDTGLDQYPWMVLLSYKPQSGGSSLNCGGSLINQRYILTAAHCVKGEIETAVGQLSKVRLGEYNLSSEIDCKDGSCNDIYIELDYEEIIAHPNYDINNKHRYNDIALIRLASDVNFTHSIRPVCLPLTTTPRRNIQTGELLIVAGWGRTLMTRQSDVKMQLAVPIVEQEECAKKFQARRISLTSTQMCAGGEIRKDSCDGDSGGPLMRKSYQSRWYLEGIVSFGHQCGLRDWPGVYTRVAAYVEWIEQNLRP